MSRRSYGVQSKCFMLNIKNMTNLIYKNRNNMENFDFENIKSVDDIDYDMVINYIYNIDNACCFEDVEGSFMTYEDEDLTYLNIEDIIIIELENDTLFKKYDDIKQVYDEIREKLKEVDIIVDNNYIKEHFGNLECSYYS